MLAASLASPNLFFVTEVVSNAQTAVPEPSSLALLAAERRYSL